MQSLTARYIVSSVSSIKDLRNSIVFVPSRILSNHSCCRSKILECNSGASTAKAKMSALKSRASWICAFLESPTELLDAGTEVGAGFARVG